MGLATCCPLGVPGMVFSQATPAVCDSDESTTDDRMSAEENENDSNSSSTDDEHEDRWRGYDPYEIWEDM
eukprot:1826205-Lingulodinium_polyedra.AAC.1